MRAALIALLLGVGLAGCVFIVRPEDSRTPQPVPFPLTCASSGEQPTAHVYFSARIERSTVNLVDEYASLMTRTVIALAGAGIDTQQAVLVRADERPGGAPVLAAWGCRLDSPEQLRPEDVLRWYATYEQLDEGPLGCVTDPVRRLGANLNEVVTQYPRGLGGTDGLSVFGGAPDIVLVVHLDPLLRRSGYDAEACASARALADVEPDGTVSWLRYAGEDLPIDRVVHWLVHTPEAIERAAFVEACRAQEGFPSHLLDLIEPSTLEVYGPLAGALGAAGAGVTRASFCEVVADDRDLLVEGALDLAGRLGLDVPEEQVVDVLDNGLPLPGGDGRIDENDLPPPG